MSASQINHNLEDCSGSDTNFAKHQVITAQNFGTRSTFWFVFSGGLNYQIEHHLFPFVNHCHLPFLAPGVKELCRKHGVDYKEALDYRKAFACHLAHTKELSKPPSALDRAAAPILDK
jgi:delta11-fatty-acid desaturase